jgi:preprotein translocase subunit YajC
MNLNQLAQLIPVIILFGLMYFFLIRPQKKKEKTAREMLNALQEGNNIITIGGIIGKIININEDEIVVETSIEKTQLKFKRWAVREVIKSE